MKRIERPVFFIGGAALVALGFSVMNAKASGFDNTSIGDLDLLFDPAKFALEFGATYVNRNVDYKASNAQWVKTGALGDAEDKNITGPNTVSATPDVWNYSAKAKFDLHDNFSCLTRLNNPGTILEETPDNWAGRFSIIKTELQTFGLDATCAVKLNLGGGHHFRVIGGGRYVEADIDVLKMTNLLSEGLSNVSLHGAGFGWRAGVAYEFPEYAIRASLIYDHEIPIEATGILKSGTLNDIPMVSEFAMPGGVEFRVQSGIAPNWLAFAGVKWVNWSSLDKLTVNDSLAGILEVNRYFNFSDGWTVTAGIGHQLTEQIQVGTSLTWDQGIGGSYSDTYQWGLGGAYKINENVTWSLGGAIVYKTAAENELVASEIAATLGPGFDINLKDQFDLSYDASVNFALTSKLKLSF